MSSPRNFHQFPRLPPEIRDFIWSLCLPHRIDEIDEPCNFLVFGLPPAPCHLCFSTLRDHRPPSVSQVCRESRAVALKTRATAPPPDYPDPAYWRSQLVVRWRWTDAARDSPHLNWTPAYEADFSADGNALARMAWEISRVSSGRGSLMLNYFLGSRSWWYTSVPIAGPTLPEQSLESEQEVSRERDRDSLRRVRRWQVVMDIIVINSDFDSAVATGLFGISGEELVKVIDAADEQACDAYYELAQRCERLAVARVTAPQKIRRQPLDTLKNYLADVIRNTYHCDDLVHTMHPAIMFRLCTAKCNERKITEVDYDY